MMLRRLVRILWLGALALPLTAGDCGGNVAHCPSESAAVGISCTDGNVPAAYAPTPLSLHLTLSAQLLATTQELVVVVRAKPIDGSDVCADLWTPDFSKTS